MTLKRLLGLKEPDTDININISNITIPLDLAIQIVFRQQQQLFGALNTLQGQLGVAEQVIGNVGLEQTHLHDYLLQLQQNLESASKHPVERVDDQTEQREQDEKKEKLH